MAPDLVCSSSVSPLACGTYFSGRNATGPVAPPPLALGCSGKTACKATYRCVGSQFSSTVFTSLGSRRKVCRIPRSADSSSESSLDSQNAPPEQPKAAFGNTRKDVLLIGLGVTALGVGLKSGLEFIGVDSLQAGNVVQLVLVLGLTIGWISTYLFRVSNKEMTYAQQLRNYEKKVMEKRLEGLTEAELEALLEQVEEEKRRLSGNGPFE